MQRGYKTYHLDQEKYQANWKYNLIRFIYIVMSKYSSNIRYKMYNATIKKQLLQQQSSKNSHNRDKPESLCFFVRLLNKAPLCSQSVDIETT